MRKYILPFCLILAISVGLVSMDKFSSKFGATQSLHSEANTSPDHPNKYSDCIGEEDFPEALIYNSDEFLSEEGTLLDEVHLALKKYEITLDSTIKNLNSIDAHKFIHAEFRRSKAQVLKDSISKIQSYYHAGIMHICYERDKSLNAISVGNLAKR